MLDGIRVLDLTDNGAAACGQILADLGADVVLVEPPGGAVSRHLGPFAGASPHPDGSLRFWARHRNKRSAELDLANDAERESFRRLAAGADVIVESFPPGSPASRWLDELADAHPRLVLVSITPFGKTGPKAEWPATDLTLTASSMALLITGDEDRPPLTSSAPQAWLNAGSEGAVGALLALTERERSGRGQRVDVSVQTAMMMTTQSFVLSHAWGDQQIQRSGGGVRLGDLRLRFLYPCKDGFVNFTFLFGDAIGPATARMFQWLYEEGFADASLRDKDWVAYGMLILTQQEPLSEMERATECLARFFRHKTKAECMAATRERALLLVPLSDAADLARSEQLAARHYWTPVPHEERDATYSYPGPFVKLSETPIRYRRRPPLLGEHTQEVLAEPQRASGRPPAAHAGASALPLDGLKVLDFTWVYAGPAITRVLADYGATVVRIETSTRVEALRSGGPFKDAVPGVERSANYGNVNLGKLGLDLNLGVPEGRALAERLVRWADVLVENYTPKVMKSWGLDWERVHELNPRLVMLSSCLSGQTGPDRLLAGYGTMGAALAGFGFVTGWPDRQPAAPFVAYTDYVSPKFATAALLAALEERGRSGKGQHVDVSQGECSMHFLADVLLDYRVNGVVQGARGNAHRDYAPSGVYPVVGDDRWLALSAPDEETWQALAKLANRGWESDVRFTTAAARAAHREPLDEALAAWTRDQDVARLERALIDAGVPAHRVSTSEDLFADPQLAHRGHFVELEHPEFGGAPYESARVVLSRTPGAPRHAAPMYGEHNERVLSELLGLSEEECTELVIAGAIG